MTEADTEVIKYKTDIWLTPPRPLVKNVFFCQLIHKNISLFPLKEARYILEAMAWDIDAAVGI